MMKKILSVLLLLGLASCVTPSDSTIDPPAELITHVRLTLKDSANMQDSVVATFTDIDGPTGSAQPVIKGVTLKGGHTYIGSIRFYEAHADRTDSLIDITPEVQELNTQHQVFYLPNNFLQLIMSVTTTDVDANGLPLGLTSVVRANDNPTHEQRKGSMQVVLSHFEQLGTKNGIDRSDESDVDIDFPVTIE